MITIRLEGVEQLQQRLANAQRQIPFTTALAINDVVDKTKASLVEGMKSSFNNPTPFVLNSLRVKKARKNDLTALIAYKEAGYKGGGLASHRLNPQVFGGSGRIMKRAEHALGGMFVPGAGMPLDQYGNPKSGELTKILSALGRLNNSGFTGNRTARSVKRSKNQNEYILIPPGKQIGGLKPGIYLRTQQAGTEYKGRRTGKTMQLSKQALKGGSFNSLTVRARGVVPMLVFTKGKPSYRPRWDFFGIAQRAMRESSPRAIENAIARALATAR